MCFNRRGGAMNKILMIWAVICFSLTGVMPANAQEKLIIPAELNAQKPGTDFWLTFHPAHETGYSNTIRVYVISEVATRVTIEVPDKGHLKTEIIEPFEVNYFVLPPNIAQCYSKGINDPPLPQKVYKGCGIHMYSEAPIKCYAISAYSLTADAFQVIPTCDLGCEYVVASWGDYTPDNDSNPSYYTSYMSVVAAHDNTVVELTLGGSKNCYTPAPDRLNFGDKEKRTMNKGDVWLLGVMGDYSDLTGTLIRSDKPVAVISGNYRTTLPSTYASRDYLIQQNAPCYSLGKEYHVTPIKYRYNAGVIRVFAGEEDATIYRDGDEWARIPKVGGAENEGWISRRVRSNEDPNRLDPVIISSDKRIAVTQYNPTTGDDGVAMDPFQLRLIPKRNFSKRCFFPSFSDSNVTGMGELINLVYQSDSSGRIPNYIVLHKIDNKGFKRIPINQIVNNPGKEFANQTGLRKWKTISFEIPEGKSTYMLESLEEISSYQYGTSTSRNEYGLPTSGNFKDISTPDSIAPVFEYVQDCDGNIEGFINDMPREEANRSNLYSFELIDEESYNYVIDTDKENFIPGMMSEIEFEANVIDKEQEAAFSLIITDRSRNKDTLRVFYTPDVTTMEPRNAAFPSILVGDTLSGKSLTFQNVSSISMQIDSIYLVSGSRKSGFEIKNADNYFGKNVDARQTFDIDFIFNSDAIRDEYEAGKTVFRDTVAVSYERIVGENDTCRYERIYSALSVYMNLDFPAIELIAPENESETSSLPEFVWQKSDIAESYLLQVSSTQDFTGLIISKQIESDTFYFAENELEIGKTYFWRVCGNKNGIQSKWSEIWSFTIGLQIPKHISPAKDAQNVSLLPKMTWESCFDVDYYIVELAGDTTFSKPIIRKGAYSEEFTSTTPLNPGTDYYRRVAVKSGGKMSDWSEVWKFTTGKSSGIEDMTDGNLRIVPNPAKEMIHIEVTGWFDYAHQPHVEVPALRQAQRPRSVKIYDLQGNLVIESRESDIDVSGLAPGMYLAVITSGEEVYQAAFLKE
jgi:hypothetical protein